LELLFIFDVRAFEISSIEVDLYREECLKHVYRFTLVPQFQNSEGRNMKIIIYCLLSEALSNRALPMPIA